MSLTEAANVAGLSRAAARRVLLTLTDLGYVARAGRDFTLSPLILELGFAYLSVQSWVERAEPMLKELSLRFEESCHAGILHASEVVVVSRSAAPKFIMATTMTVGTRLPAFHTAMGRAQLGYLEDDEIWARLRASRIEPYTPSTITDLSALAERVKSDRIEGFSIVDEELEKGLRAMAVPVFTRNGAIAGAINITAHANRTTRNEMRDNYLPALREVAARISRQIA